MTCIFTASTTSVGVRAIAALLVLCVAMTAIAGDADDAEETFGHRLPPDLIGVDVIERLDDRVPLGLPFIDDDGREITLGELFDGSVPVILHIGYNRCPMLCNLQLNELIKGLKPLEWESPERFRLLSVSVDESETHELASLKKRSYLLEYGRPASAHGWHFLTGPESSSRALANAVGFGYRWVPETQEFAHPAVLIVLTPEGRVSRYLYGVSYRTNDLRLALLEASEGKIGTTLERFLLWCYVYDPDARGYVLFATGLMRAGGALTLVILGGALSWFWIREMRHQRSGDESSVGAPSPRPAA